jgi:hypothetical protein
LRGKRLALLLLGLLGIAWAPRTLTAPPRLRLRQTLEPPPQSHDALAGVHGFSPDGSLLVIEHEPSNSNSALLVIRRVASGRIEKILAADEIAGGSAGAWSEDLAGPAFFHAFSNDGRLLAVGLRGGGTVKILDTVEWRERVKFDQEGVWACRFFPDDRELFLEGLQGFTVWEVSRARRLLAMENWHQNSPARYRISPDGRELTAVELTEASKEGERR